MWNKFKIMKKWKNKAKWQSWTTKNREEEIYKEIEKVNPMWVEEERRIYRH